MAMECQSRDRAEMNPIKKISIWINMFLKLLLIIKNY